MNLFLSVILLFSCYAYSMVPYSPRTFISIGQITVGNEFSSTCDIFDVKNATAQVLKLSAHSACCDNFEILENSFIRTTAGLIILNSKLHGRLNINCSPHSIISRSNIKNIYVYPNSQVNMQFISLKESVIEGDIVFQRSEGKELEIIMDKESVIRGEVKNAKVVQEKTIL